MADVMTNPENCIGNSWIKYADIPPVAHILYFKIIPYIRAMVKNGWNDDFYSFLDLRRNSRGGFHIRPG